MREELIRVDYGCFQNDEQTYQFDISISKGECIGIYVDDHLTSGTAYLDIFKGFSRMKRGKAFSCGKRVSSQVLARWIRQKSIIADKHRFQSRELTVGDFLIALGKSSAASQRNTTAQKLHSPEAADMAAQMEFSLPLDTSLAEVSLLDYYRLCVFRAWLWNCELLILDRLSEVLRQRDLEKLMHCVQLLQEHGTAIVLFDLEEAVMYRYTDRIDVVKDRKTCYRLYPEDYGEKLYMILGWTCRNHSAEQHEAYCGDNVMLQVEHMEFPGIPPLDFQISSGEIAFLRDENYSTAVRLRSCFLGESRWQQGIFRLDGTALSHSETVKRLGTEIGLQLERPDRSQGALFEQLSALDNLSISLLPKASKRLATRRVMDSILDEAAVWFDREKLRQPLEQWSLPERLRFSYYKWYLLNPKLLVCFFPFTGQESAHHEMIIDMLVTCAKRGMAIWVISSGIDAICEKTQNQEFLRRLRYLN